MTNGGVHMLQQKLSGSTDVVCEGYSEQLSVGSELASACICRQSPGLPVRINVVQ